MLRLNLLLAVAFFGVALAGAYAAEGHRREFAELDAQLTELDKDHDGKLDHGELVGALHALKKVADAAVVAPVDANKNGRIDHKELKRFLDADQDTKIDHGELRRYLLSIKQQHPDIYAQIVATDTPQPRGKRAEK